VVALQDDGGQVEDDVEPRLRVGAVAEDITEADSSFHAAIEAGRPHRLESFEVAVNIREYGGVHRPVSDNAALAGDGVEDAVDEGVGLVATVGLGQLDGFVNGDSRRGVGEVEQLGEGQP